MNKLELVYGPAHPDKTAPFIEEALARLAKGHGDSFIALVPTRFAAEQFRQRLLQQTNAAAVALPLVLGLDDFASRLYRLCPHRLPPQPEGALAAVVADALNERQYQLGQVNSPGLAGELTHLLSEFSAVDLNPETLVTHLADHNNNAPDGRIQTLAELYRTCRRRLTENWVDRNRILASVAQCLNRAKFRHHFPRVDWFYIQGFNTFSPPLAKLFEKLWPLLDHTQIVLDFTPDNPQLFAGTRALFNYIKEQANAISTPSWPANFPGVLAAAHLGAHSPQDGASKTTTYSLACPDRIAEVEYIARRIRQTCHGTPGGLNRIGVSFARFERYVPLVAEIFPQHGIPFRLHPGHRLAHAPLAITILAAIEVVAERYSRASLLRLLSLPFVQIEVPGVQVALTAGELDYSTRHLQPSEGRHGWLWTIDQHLDRLERDIERLDAGLAPSDEAVDPKQLSAQLHHRHQRLHHLRQGLNLLFVALAPLEPALELAVFRQRLWTAVQHLGLLNHLAPGQLAQARDGLALRRLSRLIDSLVALAPALQQKRFRPGELVDLLRRTIAGAHYQTPTTSLSVAILSLEDSPSLDLDHLFVGGLAEGDLPSLPGVDIFLSEANRQALNLPGNEAHQTHQRLLFYRAISTPRQSLWLLYPQNEGNTALLPSPFLKNLQPICDAPPPLEQGPFTTAQLHRHLGRNLALPNDQSEPPSTIALARSCLLTDLGLGVKRLVRGLRLADIRQRLNAPGPYEGVLRQDQLRQSVERRYGTHFPFSITQLETYARCPFLFFAERLLNLSPPRSPEDDLTALERGNLVHHVLYRFFSERRDAGQSARPQQEEASEALSFLRELVTQVATDMRLEGFFWQRELERIAGRKEDQQTVGLLPRFLALEIDDQDAALPAFFEFSFGSDPQMGLRDESSSQDPFMLKDPSSGKAVRLFGKIDRIDRTESGHFTVVDYKTGQVPAAVADIRRGTSLQLPIYLMAAEALLGPQGLKEGVAGVYYQVRDHEDCGKKGLFANARFKGEVFHSRSRSLVPPEDFRAYLDQARDAVIAHVAAIRKGRFHVTRHNPDHVCSFCTYRQICRIDAQRMRALERADKL